MNDRQSEHSSGDEQMQREVRYFIEYFFIFYISPMVYCRYLLAFVSTVKFLAFRIGNFRVPLMCSSEFSDECQISPVWLQLSANLNNSFAESGFYFDFTLSRYVWSLQMRMRILARFSFQAGIDLPKIQMNPWSSWLFF